MALLSRPFPGQTPAQLKGLKPRSVGVGSSKPRIVLPTDANSRIIRSLVALAATGVAVPRRQTRPRDDDDTGGERDDRWSRNRSREGYQSRDRPNDESIRDRDRYDRGSQRREWNDSRSYDDGGDEEDTRPLRNRFSTDGRGSQRQRPPSSESTPQSSTSSSSRGPVVRFGGLEIQGSAAEWLVAQKEASGGSFKASEIQKNAMRRIFDGESCCIHSPTGTGKTLCYLLPLLQRLEAEARNGASVSGLRLLILVPTADLQVQTAALARALVGPQRAETVTVLRRDSDNTTVNSIVVATPRQVMELLETPLTQHIWTHAIANLDMVVVDEADQLVAKGTRYFRKRQLSKGRVDRCVQLLQQIDEETDKVKRRDFWQLVAASATVNRATHRNLKFSSGIDISFIRSAGSQLPEAPEGNTIAGMGQYGDGTSSWPEDLRHKCHVTTPYRFPKVMAETAKVIADLNVNRVLVVLATTGDDGRVPSSVFGLSLVVAQLRYRLDPFGRYDVMTCSKAVETAAELWSVEGSKKRVLRSQSRKEVIVALSKAIRGIHLDNIEAVIVVGEPPSVGDYLHCAGRTCRYQPGKDKPVAGIAVSILPEQASERLWRWSEMSGFKLLDYRMSEQIKNQEDLPLDAVLDMSGSSDGKEPLPGNGRRAGSSKEKPIPKKDYSMFVEKQLDQKLPVAGAWGSTDS